VGVGLTVALTVLVLALPRLRREKSLVGAVLIADVDARKQLPLPNVEITAEAGAMTAHATSDSSGSFRLSWRTGMWGGEQPTLRFQHPGYQPLEVRQLSRDQLYIARMTPSVTATDAASSGPEVSVSHIRVRYAVKATTTINIGSTAKTFEVVNTGNVACEGQFPCSPDGKWKAAIRSTSLDAGEGQEFQNARVSCIAGPCPFTKIESDGFSGGGRIISVSVRNWSDTTTFLEEAEVVHTMLSDVIRRAYPSIFGRAMTFTLPPAGQGPAIEAEINGVAIVFPLGPDLNLSWASCTLQVSSGRTKLYSCELKPGYRFP
jgi:hypothetical protein